MMLLKKKHIKNLGILAMLLVLASCSNGIMDPKGVIAYEQKKLIIISIILMLLVVVPVVLMTVVFAFKYRAENKNATYTPEWSHSVKLELVWWGVPIIIVAILAYLAYTTSYSLDPKRKIASTTPNLTIEAVSLPWKWLFIYPDSEIATINYLEIPVDTPVTFRLTSDHVVDSFWIPQLGGQIYAMAGMETNLNLMASSTGLLKGNSNNYNGMGYSKMNFNVNVVSKEEFNTWVKETKSKSASNPLNLESFAKIAEPSVENPVAYYNLLEKKLFDKIMHQFMQPNAGLSKNYEEANFSSYKDRASQDVNSINSNHSK